MQPINILTAVLSAVILGAAQPADAQEKLTFRCTFGPGSAANWSSGSLAIEKGNFGKPSVDITYDAIDVKAGTARIIGNAGAADLVVLQSNEALNLNDQTGSGNYVFTTIFSAKRRGTAEFTEHPGMGLADVYAASIPAFPYRAGIHVHYQETVLHIKDGLPKMKDVPKEMGGSGVSVAE